MSIIHKEKFYCKYCSLQNKAFGDKTKWQGTNLTLICTCRRYKREVWECHTIQWSHLILATKICNSAQIKKTAKSQAEMINLNRIRQRSEFHVCTVCIRWYTTHTLSLSFSLSLFLSLPLLRYSLADAISVTYSSVCARARYLRISFAKSNGTACSSRRRSAWPPIINASRKRASAADTLASARQGRRQWWWILTTKPARGRDRLYSHGRLADQGCRLSRSRSTCHFDKAVESRHEFSHENAAKIPPTDSQHNRYDTIAVSHHGLCALRRVAT